MASTVDVKRLKEYEDAPDVLLAKINTLVQWMRESRYTVFFTGAGVSTSTGVSDYRGPTGAWTLRRIRELEDKTKTRSGLNETETKELKFLRDECDKKSGDQPTQVSAMEAQPSLSHMAQSTLIRLGLAHYVITTNLDGLYRKAGLKGHTQLCCLHGDMYVERCTGCGRDFERNYRVRVPGLHAHDHHTGRACPLCGSKNKEGSDAKVTTQDKFKGTKDTGIAFGEYLDDKDWNEMEVHCGKADLCIVAGTSMSLRHITDYPFTAKRTVIINLQETPDDAKAHLRIFAKCDPVFAAMCASLGVVPDPIPVWRPSDSVALDKIPSYVTPTARASSRLLDDMIKVREREAELRRSQGYVLPTAPSTSPLPYVLKTSTGINPLPRPPPSLATTGPKAATSSSSSSKEVKRDSSTVASASGINESDPALIIGNTHTLTNDSRHQWTVYVSNTGAVDDTTTALLVDRAIFTIKGGGKPVEVKAAPFTLTHIMPPSAASSSTAAPATLPSCDVTITVHFNGTAREPLTYEYNVDMGAAMSITRVPLPVLRTRAATVLGNIAGWVKGAIGMTPSSSSTTTVSSPAVAAASDADTVTVTATATASVDATAGAAVSVSSTPAPPPHPPSPSSTLSPSLLTPTTNTPIVASKSGRGGHGGRSSRRGK